MAKFWKKFVFVKKIFLIKPLKGDKYLKKILNKLSHIQLNYAFLLFWSIWGEIHRELFFLDIKVTISETRTEILRNLVFLTMFEWGKSWKKFGFVQTTVFDQTSKSGYNFFFYVFVHKLSHILLNYVFLLFWSILREIHREIFILDIKRLSQKRVLKYSENLFFLPCLKMLNSEKNLDLLKQLFLIKQLKGDNYWKKKFSPKCYPQSVKQCPSVVLKHFGGYS